MKVYHPQNDEFGNPVRLHNPTTPSHPSTWDDHSSIATFTPKQEGLPHKSAAMDIEGGKSHFPEPGMFNFSKSSTTAGVVMMTDEPRPRVVMVEPSNHFAGYQKTFPKGTHEGGNDLQGTALRETYEETGLNGKIEGHLGDFERGLSMSRMYHGKIKSGSPADMGWESQGVHLVPLDEIHKHVKGPDVKIAHALQQKFLTTESVSDTIRNIVLLKEQR